MSCGTSGSSLDICPTADEIVPQLTALLPRGRAWSTHDGGPFPGTPSYGFWYAVASVWEWVNGRICAMADEFFCSRQSETNDLWLEEYGLPDGCDPYADLCAKVAAIGGARCEYLTGIAAQAGWSISCYDTGGGCGGKAGRAKAGGFRAGRNPAAGTIVIRVDLKKSPAFRGTLPPKLQPQATTEGRKAGRLKAGQALACVRKGAPPVVPLAGRFKAGGRPYCPPDISGIACIVERIAGAHIVIRYEVVA